MSGLSATQLKLTALVQSMDWTKAPACAILGETSHGKVCH